MAPFENRKNSVARQSPPGRLLFRLKNNPENDTLTGKQKKPLYTFFPMKEIVICLGSSCFARGNAKNVEVAEAFLKEHNLQDDASIDVRGGLCCDRCADGPNVVIDGKVYSHVDPNAMQDILTRELLQK